MATLKEQILKVLSSRPGLTDREITDTLKSHSDNQQPTNQAARQLSDAGVISRRRRNDGLIGNYPIDGKELSHTSATQATKNHDVDALSEDEIKRVLADWLENDGWKAEVAWGRTRGIDIEASRGSERWVIEVKGPGSRQPMRVNYFISILGETLQRMNDPNARYSIALPELPQYRGLWERLPALAKSRTEVAVIFVSTDGHIDVCT